MSSTLSQNTVDTSDSQIITRRGGPLSLNESALTTLPPTEDSSGGKSTRAETDQTEMSAAEMLRQVKRRISTIRPTTFLGQNVVVKFAVIVLTEDRIWHQTTLKWVSGTRERRNPDRMIVLGVQVDLTYQPHHLGTIKASLLPGIEANYSIPSVMFDPEGERKRTSLKEEIDHANQIVSEHWYETLCEESEGMREDKGLAAMKGQISKWLVTDLTNVFE